MKEEKNQAQVEPQEEEQEQQRLIVTLRTVRNGYLLEVGDEGFMYHNEKDLLKGFAIRLGLQRLHQMTLEEIDTMLKATLDGSVERKLQQEVTELREQNIAMKRELKTLRSKVNQNGEYGQGA